MKHKLSIIYFLILCLIILISCNKEVKNVSIVKEKLSGYVQKGPFINGTVVTILELDETLKQTGRVFSTTIIDNKGTFEINDLGLSSPYLEIKAEGFYFNEVTNIKSVAPLTLSALSDITDLNTINVNILTHLETNRVIYLVSQGLSFAEAKDSACNEILTIFGFQNSLSVNTEELDISINSEENALLLAISIIVQGNRSVADLSEILANMNTDIREDGILNSNNIKTSLYNTIQNINLDSINNNLKERYETLGLDVTIPDFKSKVETYLLSESPFLIDDFVTNVSCYGLSNGSIDITIKGGEAPFIFKWSNNQTTEDMSNLEAGSYSITVTDANGYKIEKSLTVTQPDKIIVSSNIVQSPFDQSEGVIDITVNGGTPPYSFLWSNEETVEDISSLSPGLYSVEVTDKNLCQETKENRVYYKFIDSRDSVEYRAVKIGTQTWMADNLKATDYNDGTPIPYITEVINWRNLEYGAYCWYNNDESSNKELFGALYNWLTIKENTRLCPSGWHVPNDEEWKVLLNYLGGQSKAGGKLRAVDSLWGENDNGAINESGFTALPGGMREMDGDFTKSYGGIWWSSSSYGTFIDHTGYYTTLGTDYVGENVQQQTAGMSIRCIKD